MPKPKASKNKAEDVEIKPKVDDSELVRLKAMAYDTISIMEANQKRLVQINSAIAEIQAKKRT